MVIIGELFDKGRAREVFSREGDQRELQVSATEDAPALTLTNCSALAGVSMKLLTELAAVPGVVRAETSGRDEANAAGKLIAKHNLWVCFAPDDIPEAVAREDNEDSMRFRAAPLVGVDVYDVPSGNVSFLVVEDENGTQGLVEPNKDLELYVAVPPEQE